ncbi:MAG: NUDIX hydrolase [Saprospiraceae bacterium]
MSKDNNLKKIDTSNPWAVKSKETVYDNTWIEVEHHKVITPSGNDGVYGKIKMKNFAIAIIPLDHELNTWIVGQYRYTIDQYSWELPMGGGPLDIDLLVSAKRELKEETGITAAIWKYLMKIHTSNCVTDEIGHVFVAKSLSFGETDFDETEELVLKKLPFAELVEMVERSEITDSISVAGVLKLARILRL